MQVIVHRTGGETFRLLARRSQAEHLLRRLLASTAEYLQVGA
ncbi:hypothetical protein [Actinomadura sp. NBRC 104412]|nr:hypothetical protein [Actinomadura sp. NBRC 104412]